MTYAVIRQQRKTLSQPSLCVDATADEPAKEYDEEEGEDDPFDDDAFLLISKLVFSFRSHC